MLLKKARPFLNVSLGPSNPTQPHMLPYITSFPVNMLNTVLMALLAK